MNTKSKKYTFQAEGMHCKSCAYTIENKFKEQNNIKVAEVNLDSKKVLIEGDFGDKSDETIAQNLTELIKDNGYSITTKNIKEVINYGEFKIAIPVAILFAVLFIMLQKTGLVNLIQGGELNFGTAFVIGIVASLSTCMAVVGGLVLSMSATFAKEGNKVTPQVMFHLGRIFSFFLLGGVIGMLGSAFTLNLQATFVLSLLIGLVMLVLGINLLDTFPAFRKFQPSMPRFMSEKVSNLSKINNTVTPIIVGVMTFFLPCGFTQSMQIYTLSSGSFLTGGLTMLSFALGTFPVLALVSFSSLSLNKSSNKGIFFKSAGLIVIMFAIFNIINSLVISNVISPIFNF